MGGSIRTPIQRSASSSGTKRSIFRSKKSGSKSGTPPDRRTTDPLLEATTEELFVHFWSMILPILNPLSLYRILGSTRLRFTATKNSIIFLWETNRTWRVSDRSPMNRGQIWPEKWI